MTDNPYIGRFPYGKLAKYPHLKPEDIDTWERYIARYPQAYETINYDFPLGDLTELTELAATLGVAGAEKVNQYKVDVIAYRKDHIAIIELKGKATPSTIGQILSYRSLYKSKYKPNILLLPVIVAQTATPLLGELCVEQGISLIIV